MASRKKTNGKARRAAKSKAVMAVQNQPLDGGQQMQMIDTDRSDGFTKCNHGLVPSHYHWKNRGEFLNTSNDMKLCKVFLQAFVDEFDGAGGDFLAAYHATKEKKFADVWKDFGKMSFVVSFLLACGTSKVLEGNTRIARKYAALSCYFEMYVEVDLLNIRAFPSWAKINELYSADMHTLVSFLKKRIRCSCLDEKYKEVKSIPKIGLCCNAGCPLPCGKTERSLTKCCSRCRAANYCSRECQVAAWQGHKGECAFYADLKAKFESEQE
eukprot:scaffold18382_cov155-Skeletonema_dohrnii-CCMP3373.AAC.11